MFKPNMTFPEISTKSSAWSPASIKCKQLIQRKITQLYKHSAKSKKYFWCEINPLRGRKNCYSQVYLLLVHIGKRYNCTLHRSLRKCLNILESAKFLHKKMESVQKRNKRTQLDLSGSDTSTQREKAMKASLSLPQEDMDITDLGNLSIYEKNNQLAVPSNSTENDIPGMSPKTRESLERSIDAVYEDDDTVSDHSPPEWANMMTPIVKRRHVKDRIYPIDLSHSCESLACHRNPGAGLKLVHRPTAEAPTSSRDTSAQTSMTLYSATAAAPQSYYGPSLKQSSAQALTGKNYCQKSNKPVSQTLSGIVGTKRKMEIDGQAPKQFIACILPDDYPNSALDEEKKNLVLKKLEDTVKIKNGKTQDNSKKLAFLNQCSRAGVIITTCNSAPTANFVKIAIDLLNSSRPQGIPNLKCVPLDKVTFNPAFSIFFPEPGVSFQHIQDYVASSLGINTNHWIELQTARKNTGGGTRCNFLGDKEIDDKVAEDRWGDLRIQYGISTKIHIRKLINEFTDGKDTHTQDRYSACSIKSFKAKINSRSRSRPSWIRKLKKRKLQSWLRMRKPPSICWKMPTNGELPEPIESICSTKHYPAKHTENNSEFMNFTPSRNRHNTKHYCANLDRCHPEITMKSLHILNLLIRANKPSYSHLKHKIHVKKVTKTLSTVIKSKTSGNKGKYFETYYLRYHIYSPLDKTTVQKLDLLYTNITDNYWVGFKDSRRYPGHCRRRRGLARNGSDDSHGRLDMGRCTELIPSAEIKKLLFMITPDLAPSTTNNKKLEKILSRSPPDVFPSSRMLTSSDFGAGDLTVLWRQGFKPSMRNHNKKTNTEETRVKPTLILIGGVFGNDDND